MKLKNNLVLPSPNHSFRNSCLLLMCGTRKLQCHVQGLQPIEICGIGKWAQMILLCLLPSLPWHHHRIQNLQGERDRALVTWTRKKQRKSFFSLHSCMHWLIPSPWFVTYLPCECEHSSAIVQHLESGRLLGRLWWRGCLHLTNGPSSKSPTKRPHSQSTKPPATH